MPCFDGTTAPDWIVRRVSESLGGVCLFARNVETIDQVAALSAQLVAARSSVVISIDEEAGDVTRLDSSTGSRFPGNAALGQVDDAALTAAIARQAGLLLRQAGVTLNLAPSADVVIDLNNPVIGSRSFGVGAEMVARHAAAWVTGQQSAGVAACAKHFPGHGDTSIDSHHAASVIPGDMEAIRRHALPPFLAAIAAGAAAIMPGHLVVPTVTDDPATLSHLWLTDVLRHELGFTGAVVTDAMEMAGASGELGIPAACVGAIRAGADLLCIGGSTRPEEEINSIRDALVDAVLDGSLTEERLADAAARSALLGADAVHRLASDDVPYAAMSERDIIEVALKATQTAGTLPALAEPVLVLRCSETPNIAVGVVPWGPAVALDEATTHEQVLSSGSPIDAEAIRTAGTVLLVTRDRHRYQWMQDVVDRVRAVRSDAILIEMGISGVSDDDAPAIASYGATLANTRAVVDLLAGQAVSA